MKKWEIALCITLILLILLVWKSDFPNGHSFLLKNKPENIVPGLELDNLSISNNYRHTEKPEEPIVTGLGVGFSYEVTQIFFETSADDEIKEEIRCCLDECGILYENLYYTSEGYYTADLVGYKTMLTSSEYEEATQAILDAVLSWGEKHSDLKMREKESKVYVTGVYKEIR